MSFDSNDESSDLISVKQEDTSYDLSEQSKIVQDEGNLETIKES